MKTYAWINAIANSKKNTNKIILIGINTKYRTFFFDIWIAKPLSINNNVCPANILANNLIAKLKGRIIYEIISIPIKKYKSNLFETPEGTKYLKKLNLLFIKPNNVIPKKIEIEINAVIYKWLVIVNPNGVNPNKLLNKIIKKILKINGKYCKDV